MAARQQWDAELVVIADPELLQQRANILGLSIGLQTMDPEAPPTQHQAGILKIAPVTLATPAVPGKLDPANAPYILATLQQAVDGCLAGTYQAMVTAPVQKSVINDAGIPFSGHTEFLAKAT